MLRSRGPLYFRKFVYPHTMNRRQFGLGVVSSYLASGGVQPARAQQACDFANSSVGSCPKPQFSKALSPFRLRLVREAKWPTTISSLNQCIRGRLFEVAQFDLSDAGTEICHTLELPWRNNLSGISAIPTGIYPSWACDGGRLGWRLAMDCVDGRTAIRVHIGNRPSEIQGCILVGLKSVSNHCRVLRSGPALEDLQSRLGSANRKIEFEVRDPNSL